MRAEPSVIKRPVVEWPDGRTTVGFDAATWEALAGGPLRSELLPSIYWYGRAMCGAAA